MPLARVHSVAVVGVDGHVVEVQACITAGVPGTHLTGLSDLVLAETRDRVRAAILNADLPWPDRHTTVALSPASLPKHGSRFDLAIAVAILAANGSVPADACRDTVLLGELALDGRIRPVPGVLPALQAAAAAGVTTAVVPQGNAAEARLVTPVTVTAVDHLAAAVAHLRGQPPPTLAAAPAAAGPELWPASTYPPPSRPARTIDLTDLAIPPQVCRALEIAAAGGHTLLLRGPAGSTSLLAEQLPALLPDLTGEQARQVTAIYSVAGLLDPADPLITRPPLIAPQPSLTRAGLVGSISRHGTRPGAISLAHHGILLINDATSFPASVLDALRGPLEEREVELHQGGLIARLPADCQIVLTATRCPCGADPASCRCTPVERARHQAALQTSLVHRIDLVIDLPGDTPAARRRPGAGEPTAVSAQRVRHARDRAAARREGIPWVTNGQIPAPAILRHLPLSDDAAAPLADAKTQGLLSALGARSVLRTAWTIADLDRCPEPGPGHVAEALALYRSHPAT
jgi:magnesium chelatase family protein